MLGARRFWTHRFPALAYVVAVFVACTIPVALPQRSGPWSDKSDHLLAFLILEILLVRALQGPDDASSPRSTPRRSLVVGRHGIAVALCIGYGGVIEAWQGLLPWRSMELMDWGADALGAVLGALSHLLVLRSCKPAATA